MSVLVDVLAVIGAVTVIEFAAIVAVAVVAASRRHRHDQAVDTELDLLLAETDA